MYGSPWNCRNSRPFHHRPRRKFAADALVGCHLTLVSSLYLSPLWREPHGSRSLVAWRTWGLLKSTWQGIQLKVPLLFGKILVSFKTTSKVVPPNCGHVVTWPFWPASLYISLESWIDSGGLNHEPWASSGVSHSCTNGEFSWGMKKWRSSWEDKGKILMSFQHLDQKVWFYGGDICGSVCWDSNRCQRVLGCNNSSSNYYSIIKHHNNINNNNAGSQFLLSLSSSSSSLLLISIIN